MLGQQNAFLHCNLKILHGAYYVAPQGMRKEYRLSLFFRIRLFNSIDWFPVSSNHESFILCKTSWNLVQSTALHSLKQ